jgi:hypothetical protein
MVTSVAEAKDDSYPTRILKQALLFLAVVNRGLWTVARFLLVVVVVLVLVIDLQKFSILKFHFCPCTARSRRPQAVLSGSATR